MYLFGAGNLFLTPSGTNPTPVKVGTLQDVSLDISFEQKELYGNKQFPVMVARGKGKITGKAKSGEFAGGLIQSILSGSTKTAGTRMLQATERLSIPGSVSYIVTAAHAAATTVDLGVTYVATGLPATRVAPGAEAAGKYSYASGVWTFAVADKSLVVDCSYTYVDATGSTILYSNQLMGSQIIYSAGLYNVEPDGSAFGIKLKNIVIPKVALGFKNDDYTMPDLDLAAFAASDDTILELYTPET